MTTSVEDQMKTRENLLKTIVVELTDVCNLRCVYCHQNSDDFTHKPDMPLDTFAKIVDYCTYNKVSSVNFTGAGETTMAKDWHILCRQLLDVNVPLSITVNLARMLTTEEIDTLMRFSVITVSVDTADREVLRTIRKSVDIRTITHNVIAIRAAAIKRGTKKPRFIFSSVLSAEVAPYFGNLAAFAAACGAHVLNIQDLVEYVSIERNATQVWLLAGDAAHKAASEIREAIAICGRAGIEFQPPPDFLLRLEQLEARSHHGAVIGAEIQRTKGRSSVGEAYTVTRGVDAGETRDCTDPWSFIQILSNSEVRPCCFSEVRAGSLHATNTIMDVMNSPTVKQLRRQLLDGTLDDYCRICSFKPIIKTDAYRHKMAAYLGIDEGDIPEEHR
jgi:MoaA/NifB/PqqE/SkfB family radical SAM enzyme